jgi:hypothetical protein
VLGSPQRSADDAKGYIVYRRSPTLGHPLSSNLCFALNFHRMSCSRPVVVYSPPFVPSSYTILSCTSNSIFYKYLILGSASMARFSRVCCVDVTRVFLVFPSCQNDSPASPYLANGKSESEMGSQQAAKSLNLPGPSQHERNGQYAYLARQCRAASRNPKVQGTGFKTSAPTSGRTRYAT